MTKIERTLILNALNHAYDILGYYRPDRFIDLEAEKSYDAALTHIDAVRQGIEGKP